MERRLSAILAADMVGFSRLMETDEVGTLQRQNVLRAELIDPIFKEYHGRIVKEMGDGILVEFPSAVEAVQCAVIIQRGMADREASISNEKRIQYRIGINLGDIIIEGDDIFGDGVNVAARLEQIAEPGGICISGTTFDHLKSKVEVGYESLGDVQVKNIDRPIRAYKVLTNPNQVGEVIEKKQSGVVGIGQLTVIVAVLIVVIVGGGSWWWSQQPNTELVDTTNMAYRSPDKPSIAVLPFANIGGDPNQEYFVDGMTDDLITDLSKISALFVIARNSVFAYKGRNVEPGEVAKGFGVRYVLNGSVRTSGGRIRINSQLIDTRTGGQIWADRFDRELDDIFALQDDVTKKIVTALSLKLTTEETERLEGSEAKTTRQVYDLYLRGVDAIRQFRAESERAHESVLQSRFYLQKALSLDPNYARALAAMAYTYTLVLDVVIDKDELNQALNYATRALEYDPNLPQGHFAMAFVQLQLGKYDMAEKAARNAIEFDPNYADGYATLALILAFSGQGQEAILHIRRAMQLNPRYPGLYLSVLGYGYFAEGQYDKAISQFDECILRDPSVVNCRAMRAAMYAIVGRKSDAEWEVQEILNLAPKFSIGSNSYSHRFSKPELRAEFERALRLAGLPD